LPKGRLSPHVWDGVQTVQSSSSGQWREAVYNLAIPNVIPTVVPNSVIRALRLAPGLRVVAELSFAILGLAMAARGVDWNGPEQQLAKKIVAVTGPGAVVLTVENRSSVSKRDSDIIQDGLRSALQGLGVRFVKEESATTVAITLSENSTSYVWVAQIRRPAGESVGDAAVVMVAAGRAEGQATARESVPLSLRKVSLWTQDDPILDVAALEENATPMRIAVLDAEKVALYRQQAGKWQQELTLGIVHARPWPRDLRGRLIPARDHLLDVYLPGVVCRIAAGASLAMNCRETDDPWPLIPAALSGGTFSGPSSVFPSAAVPSAGSPSVAIPPVGAFYAPSRNFFTGVVTPGVGKLTTVSKFYSAAFLPREKYLLWLFAGTDSRVHMVDGISDQATKLNWGSDLAPVKTACGAGWQVLATSSDEGSASSVRAYEFPDRDPIAVSDGIDFPGAGAITALWTEAKADTAVAVTRNRETGSYEAFRLAVACSQ